MTGYSTRDEMKQAKLLSPQQTVVMQHLGDGLMVKEIACLTNLSVVTVRRYINKAKKKLGAKTQNHAVALAVARCEINVNMENTLYNE